MFEASKSLQGGKTMEQLVNWLHEQGAVLVGNRDSVEERVDAELHLLSVASDSEAAPLARVIAYRYLNSPGVMFVDEDSASFLADLRRSDDPRDCEIITEAEKQA